MLRNEEKSKKNMKILKMMKIIILL